MPHQFTALAIFGPIRQEVAQHCKNDKVDLVDYEHAAESKKLSA